MDFEFYLKRIVLGLTLMAFSTGVFFVLCNIPQSTDIFIWGGRILEVLLILFIALLIGDLSIVEKPMGEDTDDPN